MIDFPASPTIGDQFTSGGTTWEWDGAKWTIVPGTSGPPVIISDTPPASPVVGDLWWDSIGGQLYCWFVENITPSNLKFPGVKIAPRDEYQLSYKTNPDQVNVSFVPDIGITHYEYRLHGSITDTTLVLTEFHPAEAKK